MNKGYLTINVYNNDISQPIKDAIVKINDQIYNTNELGQTTPITLETYSKENSSTLKNINPYKSYNISVKKEGLTSVNINNIEIFPDVTSIQNVYLQSLDISGIDTTTINNPPIVINGLYSPLYNDIIKNSQNYVLKEVIIPEYIIVHDGTPSSVGVPKYYVTFSDYIKNVACSEIYSSWNKEAIKANVLAIISFTLNRVYTEWYPSKGYNFTITSVTAYDQKYTHNRTTFDTINKIVDEMILKYIKRPNKQEPILAQYCDGKNLKNEGWLWQWGSQELSQQGYTYDEILKYYYGNDLEFKSANYTKGLPTSFPGYNLELGMCNEDIKKVQNELNIIRGNYPGLIQINEPNGNFDQNTKDSIIFFQKTFNLSTTGIIDYSTWYKISYLYLAVKRMIFGVYDRE